MLTRLRAAIVAALFALFLIGSDLIPRVIAEDGTLMNLVGRVDSTTHALAVTSVSATGTDIPGALSGLVGSTDSTTRALKVYFDTTAASVLPTSLQLGGTTSSFPMLKRSAANILVRLADDSGYTSILAAGVSTSTLNINVASPVLLASSTPPTVSSGFGTSPSIVNSNGTAAFTVNVGTGGVATSGVLALPTATTGWNCFVDDRAGGVATRMSATTTTTATITAAVRVGGERHPVRQLLRILGANHVLPVRPVRQTSSGAHRLLKTYDQGCTALCVGRRSLDPALYVHPPCPECGGATERRWKRVGMIGDEIPGGQWIENLGDTPVKVYSKSELKAEAAARGLELRVKHAPLPGTDKSAHTTRWTAAPAMTLPAHYQDKALTINAPATERPAVETAA
jgi:hypothetical protein